jgi:hydroxylamine reductase (hybrid-cluster protein)
MSWLETFKIALIKHDEEQMLSLIDTLPQFEHENDMLQASLLIQQAVEYFKQREQDATIEMQKILKAKKYLDN